MNLQLKLPILNFRITRLRIRRVLFFLFMGWGLLCVFLVQTTFAQKVPKPLYDDPIEHGAADPVIIYNKHVNKWWMFYTNRRATLTDSTGVQWVHGTRIGIAESSNGRSWKYRDTANINYRPDSGYTHWAPDVFENNGTYHMYLTYVPGVFKDWNHPRVIVHLTSPDLQNWNYQSTLKLANAWLPSDPTNNIWRQKVIDASVYKISDTLYRMWYNNERDGKSIYYADSKDLYNWADKGKAIATRGEGPKVFYWQQQYFMIVDAWKGMEIFSSKDLLNWTKQTNRILENPGKGKDDQFIGGHCDVVVNNNRAFVYYFTHPGRRKDKPAPRGSFNDKRSVVQLAEFKYVNGEITCNRDGKLKMKLKH
jgi:hypothetical protein